MTESVGRRELKNPSGIEAPSSITGIFNVANGAQNQGFPYSTSLVEEDMKDDSGTAAAESQIIIDNPTGTYSIALHVFHIVDTDPNTGGNQFYCEAYGTATAGG